MPRPLLLSLLVVLATAVVCAADVTPISTALNGTHVNQTTYYYIRQATNSTSTPLQNLSLAATLADTGLYGDDDTLIVTLPFPVQVYNDTYTNVSLSTNGDVQLQATTNDWLPDDGLLPDDTFGVAVFPFNYDLVNDQSAGEAIQLATFGVTPNRLAVLDWSAHTYDGSFPVHFQVWFYENTTTGEFTFAYDSDVAALISVGDQLTVGVQQGINAFSQYFGLIDSYIRLDFAITSDDATSGDLSSSSTGADSSSSTGGASELDSSSGAYFNSSSSSSSSSSTGGNSSCVHCAASQFAPHALTLLLLALALIAQRTFA